MCGDVVYVIHWYSAKKWFGMAEMSATLRVDSEKLKKSRSKTIRGVKENGS